MLALLHARGVLAARGGRDVEQIDRVADGLRLAGRARSACRTSPGIDVGARIRQYLTSIGQDARGGPAVRGARPAVRDGPLRPEDGRGLVSLRGGQPRRASPIRWSSRSRPRRPRKRGIKRRTIDDDEILARDHHGARQRGRARARGRLRPARRRHRRHLLLRLRLSAPPRRADVLRGHGRSADGAGARAASTASASATTGRWRRCWSGWWRRAAASRHRRHRQCDVRWTNSAWRAGSGWAAGC